MWRARCSEEDVEEQGLKMGMHRIGRSVMRKSGLIRNCYAVELERSGGC